MDSAPCCNQHLYEILAQIAKILDDAKIDYFIFYGTLLGYVRHDGGFIPWDTDVDICILEEQREATRKILQEKLQANHILEYVNQHWDMINYSSTNKVHADLYYFSTESDQVFLKGYEHIRYPRSEIFPTQRVKIYDISVNAPADLSSIRAKYGDHFQTEAYRQYALFQRKTTEFYPAKLCKDHTDN